jgi:hypothetical protein
MQFTFLRASSYGSAFGLRGPMSSHAAEGLGSDPIIPGFILAL